MSLKQNPNQSDDKMAAPNQRKGKYYTEPWELTVLRARENAIGQGLVLSLID